MVAGYQGSSTSAGHGEQDVPANHCVHGDEERVLMWKRRASAHYVLRQDLPGGCPVPERPPRAAFWTR
jgi:hypothetical protein